MGHSNGVRLIGNDATNHRFVERIKQRMKHWNIIRKRQTYFLIETLNQLVFIQVKLERIE